MEAVLNFITYIQNVVRDTCAYAGFAIKNLCIAWYPMTVLTLIPVAHVKIPHYFSIVYLLAYCICAGLVCISKPIGIQRKKTNENMTTEFMRTIKIDAR